MATLQLRSHANAAHSPEHVRSHIFSSIESQTPVLARCTDGLRQMVVLALEKAHHIVKIREVPMFRYVSVGV